MIRLVGSARGGSVNRDLVWMGGLICKIYNFFLASPGSNLNALSKSKESKEEGDDPHDLK